jgi:hypothetical protein
MISKLDLLTYHEAGHAAVAFSFGLRLKAVRINQVDDKTEPADGQEPTSYQNVVMRLAGSRAEMVLDEDSLSHSTLNVEDEHLIETCLEECFAHRLQCHTPEEAGHIYSRVRDRLAYRCEGIVRDMWPAIQRLAAELAKRSELSGEEVERILAGW